MIGYNTATKITWDAEVYDAGLGFANSQWTPGKVGPVILSTAIDWTNVVVGGAEHILIFRDGVELGRQPHFNNTVNESVSIVYQDYCPTTTNVYSLWVFSFNDVGGTNGIRPTATRTWFSGSTIP